MDKTEFGVHVRQAMVATLGDSMLSDDYPGNPDYITSEEIAEVSRLLWDRLVPRWQSIETAPKDGTRVLIWDPNLTHPITAEFRPFRDRSAWVLGDASCSYSPTHWMPLPEPPAGG